MIYIQLFFEFLQIGFFSIGGGLATLPFLYELAERTAWFSTEELMAMIAVSESTPGPIGVNMATYVGYNVGGLGGGIIATLGLIIPAFVIVFFLARILQKFKESKKVQAAFYGIRPAVSALIAVTAGGIMMTVLLDLSFQVKLKSLFLFCLLFWLIEKYKKHPALYIAFAAVIGWMFPL